MDLSNRALEFSATITPRLVSGLPTHYDAGNTSDQSCLHHPSPDDTIEEQEERIDGFRKVKMFEMAPSADPELEERRQRAIYAKNNRNTKKRELENLQHESSALRTANTQCQANLTRMHGVIEDQQRKIEQLEECVSDTCHQLRDKDEQIRNSQIKLSHLKAHLELIADGLDDNMSRRLLLNLLAQS
ncbi:hypothetical protein E2C01_048663 [Portunus trituberculatus]|uniref:BZIP domain-containing protein n=1 Tax=Portunus trituberculatus TaxID=210409 RepID=A0A5B7GC83_PORTR|nr:hypothetical protein [Portunus trituberculatus]